MFMAPAEHMHTSRCSRDVYCVGGALGEEGEVSLLDTHRHRHRHTGGVGWGVGIKRTRGLGWGVGSGVSIVWARARAHLPQHGDALEGLHGHVLRDEEHAVVREVEVVPAPPVGPVLRVPALPVLLVCAWSTWPMEVEEVCEGCGPLVMACVHEKGRGSGGLVTRGAVDGVARV
jgi:hypothetical protein